MMPTLQPDPERSKSGESSYRRDVRLHHDGGRHADAQQLLPPPQQPVVSVGNDSPTGNESPINLCGDDGVPSTGNQNAVILVDINNDHDPASEDEYSLDVVSARVCCFVSCSNSLTKACFVK